MPKFTWSVSISLQTILKIHANCKDMTAKGVHMGFTFLGSLMEQRGKWVIIYWYGHSSLLLDICRITPMCTLTPLSNLNYFIQHEHLLPNGEDYNREKRNRLISHYEQWKGTNCRKLELKLKNNNNYLENHDILVVQLPLEQHIFHLQRRSLTYHGHKRIPEEKQLNHAHDMSFAARE